MTCFAGVVATREFDAKFSILFAQSAHINLIPVYIVHFGSQRTGNNRDTLPETRSYIFRRHAIVVVDLVFVLRLSVVSLIVTPVELKTL